MRASIAAMAPATPAQSMSTSAGGPVSSSDATARRPRSAATVRRSGAGSTSSRSGPGYHEGARSRPAGQGDAGGVVRGGPRVTQAGGGHVGQARGNLDDMIRGQAEALGEAAPEAEHPGDPGAVLAQPLVARLTRRAAAAPYEDRSGHPAPDERRVGAGGDADHRPDWFVPEHEGQLRTIGGAAHNVQVRPADAAGADRDLDRAGWPFRLGDLGDMQPLRWQLAQDRGLHEPGPVGRMSEVAMRTQRIRSPVRASKSFIWATSSSRRIEPPTLRPARAGNLHVSVSSPTRTTTWVSGPSGSMISPAAATTGT